jgi:hypothetical protein
MSDELIRVDVDSGKYTVLMRENEQVRILRYGEEWMGPGFPGANAVIALACELGELRAAGVDLYKAGRWNCDRPVDAAGLWTRFRDALGLAPGTATALGMNQQPSDVIPMSDEVREFIRNLFASYATELKELRDRRDSLLEANTREVLARREVVNAARALRAAQRAYMADRGNEELGKAVGAAAAELDRVLGDA